MSEREQVSGGGSQEEGSAQGGTAEDEEGRGGYLSQGERVGHWVYENLAEFPVQVGALDPVQVSVHPEDPVETNYRS